jgi:D-Tyr-tRNAtyr deacylase
MAGTGVHCCHLQIGPGLLVLMCAEPDDTEAVGEKMLAKILKLRIFSDEAGKMNRSVQDTGGGLLIVIGVLLVTGWWDGATIWMRTWANGFSPAL